MLKIKHIVFPVDLSERSRSTAPFVSAMARRFGAEVTLISVAPFLPYCAAVEPGMATMLDYDQMKSDLQMMLDGVLIEEFKDVSVRRIAEVGTPAEIITRLAHDEKTDLIMMPTHGYGPFRRLLLGSVTAKVLHDAHCPVWTTAHSEEPLTSQHVNCRNVMCAVDGGEQSLSLIKWAAKFSERTGASLRVVHVTGRSEPWEEALAKTLREEARERIQGLLDSADIAAPLCVASGSVDELVRCEALRHSADLIVVGRGILQGSLGRLRTNVYGIIRQSPCPVLSI